MAASKRFKAYDLRRRRSHNLPLPPARVTNHHIRPGEWSRGTKSRPNNSNAAKRRRSSSSRPAKQGVQSAADVLFNDSYEWYCQHCGRFGDDPDCGKHCYKAFRKQFVPDLIDIKGPSELGYGAFVKPGKQIKKGQYLDEYLGDIRPIGAETDGRYCFFIGETCIIDAERTGNWTRFANSSCRPNTTAFSASVGRQSAILFRASKDIGPGEEILINYGRRYFERVGFRCQCGVLDTPHLPGDAKKMKRGGGAGTVDQEEEEGDTIVVAGSRRYDEEEDGDTIVVRHWK